MQAGYSAKGGGFANALGRLRSLGLINRGEPIRITGAGLDRIAGSYEPLPSGHALFDYWLAQLGRAERLILIEAAEAYPSSLSKEELAERTGYSLTGGGFANALGKLRRLELIEGRGEIRAEPTIAEAFMRGH